MTYAYGANFSRIFEIPDSDLPIYYATFMTMRLRQMELSAKTVYDPVLKITQLSAHAQNHVSIERCRKSFATIVPPKVAYTHTFQPMSIVNKNGLMDQEPLGTKVGLGPGHIVLDGDQALLPPKRGTTAPIFSPSLLWPNCWMDQDATWYGCRPRQATLC